MKMPTAEEVEKVAKDVGEQQGLAWLYLGQFATLLRMMESGEGTPETDALVGKHTDQDVDLFTNWSCEASAQYQELSDHARSLELISRAVRAVAEREAIERCIAWLKGAQVDESGRLILTRDFISANLRSLLPADEGKVKL